MKIIVGDFSSKESQPRALNDLPFRARLVMEIEGQRIKKPKSKNNHRIQ